MLIGNQLNFFEHFTRMRTKFTRRKNSCLRCSTLSLPHIKMAFPIRHLSNSLILSKTFFTNAHIIAKGKFRFLLQCKNAMQISVAKLKCKFLLQKSVFAKKWSLTKISNLNFHIIKCINDSVLSWEWKDRDVRWTLAAFSSDPLLIWLSHDLNESNRFAHNYCSWTAVPHRL